MPPKSVPILKLYQHNGSNAKIANIVQFKLSLTAQNTSMATVQILRYVA